MGRILIHVNVKRRDSLAMLVLSLWLRSYGHEVYLCGSHMLREYIRVLEPNVVILNNLATLTNDETMALGRTSWLVVIPGEGLYFRDTQIEHKFVLRDARKYIDKFFFWGPRVRDYLVGNNIIDPSQAMVVGNPRFDLYLSYNFGMVDEGRKCGGRRNGAIGLLGRFTVVCPRNRRSVFNLVKGFVDSRGGWYYEAGGNVEDIFWYQVACVRVYMEILAAIAKDPGLRVVCRPHPEEDIDAYRELVKEYGPHCEVDGSLGYEDWLRQLSCMIMPYSTSMVEAIISGVPVITVHGLVGGRLREHYVNAPAWMDGELLQFCHCPTSINEMLDMVRQASKGYLEPIKVENHELQEIFKAYYDWPREEWSTLSIAREIDRLVRNGNGLRSMDRRGSSGKLARYRPGIVKVLGKDMVRYLASYFASKLGSRALDRLRILNNYNYSPWEKAVTDGGLSVFRRIAAISKEQKLDIPDISWLS